MGRLSLLLVLAAAIGGSVLTLGTRLAALEMTSSQSEDQEDALAREIAETGESLVLARMMGPNGFINPITNGLDGPVEYAGGEFEVDIEPSAFSAMEVTFTVTGTYGGARHAIQSTYEFDPMDAPGPLWLDVPYATATVASGASISGSATDHPAHFDRRRHDALGVESLVSLGGLKSVLGATISSAGSALAVPDAADWVGDTGLLEDLNVRDAEGMYQAAIGAMSTMDRTIIGNRDEKGRSIWGTAAQTDQITLVTGDLTVSGHVSGHGALVVDGALRVPEEGKLDWDGIIIVRGERNVLAVELDGKVNLTGTLIVSQEAIPPGGHLDVSTYHNPTDASPSGVIAGRPSPVDQPGTAWSATHPWWQHSHGFNLTPTSAPRGNHVYYLSGGTAGRHENAVEFQRRLASIPRDEQVYLEFANPENHGFAQYNIVLAGVDNPIRGTIRGGFPAAFASTESPVRSKTFAAGDLRDFDLEVRSLRSLLQSFDAPLATGWPTLIGQDSDRRESLAVRLVRASDSARLYESTLYWHMRQDEVATHQAEEAAWRLRILAGEEFGTRLRLGDDVTITYETAPIALLSDKLGFDGNEVVLLSTAANHQTAAERRTEMIVTGNQEDVEGGVVVCHDPGKREQTMRMVPQEVPGHLRHGDTAGECTGEGSRKPEKSEKSEKS